MKLLHKVALITGASSGIGRATAIALAKEGCAVIINYKRNTAAAQETLTLCNSFSSGNIVVRADITDENAVGKMISAIKKKHHHIDILINNAGIYDEKDNITNVAVFEKILKINFLGHIIVIKHVLPLMKSGKIVNISSIHGRLGYGRPTLAAYSASKAALENYTKNLAKGLAPRILVNAVAPGRVATPMWDNPSAQQQKKLGRVHLIKRMIQPAEIAEAIVFLAKNDAVCGEILAIDGGFKLKEIN